MEKGFATVAVILIIIGVLTLGFLGYQFTKPRPAQPSKPSEITPVSTPIPTPTPSEKETLTADWVEYGDDQYGFQLKYPSDWGQDPAYTYKTDSLSRLALVSNPTPGAQLDPMAKISHFDILVSTADLKTDVDYSHWFLGLDEPSQVDFKGVSAEKYTATADMPAGSYYKEMYYFKKGNIYFLLSLGIYTTPDLKEENQKILEGFLAAFEFKKFKT